MAKRKRSRSERRREARAAGDLASSTAAAPSGDTKKAAAVTSSRTPRPASARRAKPPRSNHKRSLPLGTIGWVVGGAAVLGLLAVLLTSAGGSQAADAATEQLARQNAGTDVTVHSGRQHVVYHSDPPLPTANAPRADGQPTLVWFSGTWCHICERMAPFAHETASGYTDQLVFVEKSVDHDRESSGRYGVRGTPTFIMLDAVGSEVTRFHGAGDAASFASAIEQALSAVES